MLIHPERLKGVNTTLVEAVEKVSLLLKYDVLIVCGRRTVEEQEALYKKKLSKVKGPKAPHVLGIAVDLCPMIAGKCLWNDLGKFAEMRRELEKLVKLNPEINWDRCHFQLLSS